MTKKKDIQKKLREQLAKIEGYLPSHYAAEVANRLKGNYKPATIRKAKNGGQCDNRILEELLRMAKEEQERIESVLKTEESCETNS